MKEYYTIAEMLRYPGINHKFIADCEKTLNTSGKYESVFGRKTLVYSRDEFMKIMEAKGYELVQIEGKGYWVRFRVADI
ncbi:MAG: hypothetical protein KF713_05745 [Turneriella sp.]|nr:hypothetical protein [Turneriella sp.]